ncbi:MAG: peptide chain release factor N(5)-glutamine methyltransferase [Hyphomicrobium sp.]
MPEIPSSGPAGGPTVREVLADAHRHLQRAGIEDAARDVRLLVSGILGISDLDQIARPEAAIHQSDRERFAAAIARRAAREPVSRILGRRHFFGREFLVTPATLDPRPDTETVVELTLHLVDERGWRTRPVRILDVGTGTGCILLSLLAELPMASGLGRDIDASALVTAEANATRLGLGERAQFALGRSLEGLTRSFDVVVSNPPYIPTAELPGLEPEVRAFDPLAALDGGVDGLCVYREIISGLKAVLPAGLVVFEVGAGQAADVQTLLAAEMPNSVFHRRVDLGGHARGVACWTQSKAARE